MPVMPTLNDVIHGDSAEVLHGFPDSTVHAIVSDIPYGIAVEEWDVLHANQNSALRGSSPAQLEAGKIFKSRGKPLNGWSEADRRIPREYQDWCATWASEWLRVLKPGGSAVVFAGRRLSHRCVCAMEDAGFTLKDTIAWVRRRAPHRAQRLSVVFARRGDEQSAADWDGWRVGNLRPTFEPVLWLTKPYKIGTTVADNALAHGVGGYNESAFVKIVGRPENVIESDLQTSERGYHPTQKPLLLMQALIELVTQRGQLVVDPFCGSGSTLVAARDCGRDYLGIESDSGYCEVARQRLAGDLFGRSGTGSE